MSIAATHGLPAETDVTAILQRLDAGRALSARELEQHIADCTLLMERAYQRFEQHQNPADRDEAVLWMHRRDAAVLLRPGVAQMLGREAA